MIASIQEYLRQLRQELAGCDRATVQDALADAEEYLSNALNGAREAQPAIPEQDAVSAIIEKYGLPEEVAASYRDAESRMRPFFSRVVSGNHRSWFVRFFGVVADLRAWGALFYMIFSLATGIIYFTWAITGISVSLGLLVLVIGIPLAGLFMLSVRGLALVEGRIVEGLLGEQMPRRPLFSARSTGLWVRFKSLFTDRYTWFSLAYMIIHMPLGIISFSVFVPLVFTSLYLMARPIMELAYDIPLFSSYYVGYYTPGWLMPVAVVGGILLFVLTMHLVKVFGRLRAALAKAMLVRE